MPIRHIKSSCPPDIDKPFHFNLLTLNYNEILLYLSSLPYLTLVAQPLQNRELIKFSKISFFIALSPVEGSRSGWEVDKELLLRIAIKVNSLGSI
jgi:hypothetical protein